MTLALFVAVAAATAVCAAPAQAGGHDRVLVAGIYDSPPFCIKTPDGHWTGLSVELWDRIAKQAGLKYAWKESTFEDLLKNVANGDVDIAIGPISMTSDREEIMDFTHPYYVSDLCIAVPSKPYFFPWTDVAAEFLTMAWLKLLVVLLVMLAISGVAVWVFERHHNRNQFGGNWHHGLGSGFWWAAVTMSGVGYGDKAPMTMGGRVIALLWMFVSVITVALVTASVTSVVVASRASYSIHTPRDLGHARISVLDGSTAEKFALEARIDYSFYPTAGACLHAVLAKEVDACVGNEVELRYLAKKDFPHVIDILPFTFQREDCSFALPPNSSLLETVNRALLSQVESRDWHALRAKYLGN